MSESMKEQGIPSRREIEKTLQERITPQIYEKMKRAEIGIAGLGGLGSNIAVMLARTGIGHLHLVDFDKVDLTNLNRQAYHISHLNRLKTDALKELLLEINPYLDVTTKTVRVTKDNATELFGKYAIVCEAFDHPENKAMLVNTLLEQCPQMKIISGSGMAGYGSANDIVTKRAMKNLYICGDGITEVKQGISLIASRVSICAGHQANMVIRLILGIENE